MQDQVERVFREVLHVEIPSPDTDILETGLLDSLALVTLLFELEERFSVKIPLAQLDLEDIRTVGRIALLVEALVLEETSRSSKADGRAQ